MMKRKPMSRRKRTMKHGGMAGKSGSPMKLAYGPKGGAKR